MTVSPIGSTGTTATTTSQQSDALSASDQINQNTFLQLMVAQLKNQDPLNPTDSSQFLAQTAQFSSVAKLTEVAQQSQQALTAQMEFGAAGLVGKTVSYTDTDGNAQKGSVGSVSFTASGPTLNIDGTDVPIANVVGVSA